MRTHVPDPANLGDPGQDLGLCSFPTGTERSQNGSVEVHARGAGQALLGCTENMIDGARGRVG